jgi:hypothetical protein
MQHRVHFLSTGLADCCGARSGGISFCRDARCRKMLVARVCARTASFTSILPVLLSFQILLPYPPLPSGCPPLTTTSVVAAGGEPGRSWTAARRPHRGPRAGGGPCEGGRPRGWPGLSRAPARTPQSARDGVCRPRVAAEQGDGRDATGSRATGQTDGRTAEQASSRADGRADGWQASSRADGRADG